jgi:Family of unknown function (DUF6459)
VTSPLVALPDPAPTLRLLPTPAWEPPYCEGSEETSTASPLGRRAPSMSQGKLPLTFLLPTGVPVVPQTPTLRLVEPHAGAGVPLAQPDEVFDRQPTRRADLPDPRFWAGRLAQAMLEVEAGVRPVAQLRRWTSEAVYTRLRRSSHRTRFIQARAAQAEPGRVWVRSLRVCEPADGIAEVSAVVQDAGRTRAMAMRLEGADGRWRCTALEQA